MYRNRTTPSDHSPPPPENADDKSESVLVLFGFFFVILGLFFLGLGCSYLYYKRATKKQEEALQRAERGRAERRSQQIRFRALAAAQFFRGVPNSYSPTPKDEKTHLLPPEPEFPVVPVRVQSD